MKIRRQYLPSMIRNHLKTVLHRIWINKGFSVLHTSGLECQRRSGKAFEIRRMSDRSPKERVQFFETRPTIL